MDEEILINRNPRGGRPQGFGKTIFVGLDRPESLFEVSEVKESLSRRFFLGYCPCGRKCVIGDSRASILMQILKQHGVEPRKHTVGQRLAKSFLKAFAE